MAQAPTIIRPRLTSRQTNRFRAIFCQELPGRQIFTKYRKQSIKELVGREPYLCQPCFMKLEIKLLIVLFPPGILGADRNLLDASVGQQPLPQPLCPTIQLIVVVAIHINPVGARTLPHIVAESLIRQAGNVPTATA